MKVRFKRENNSTAMMCRCEDPVNSEREHEHDILNVECKNESNVKLLCGRKTSKNTVCRRLSEARSVCKCEHCSKRSTLETNVKVTNVCKPGNTVECECKSENFATTLHITETCVWFRHRKRKPKVVGFSGWQPQPGIVWMVMVLTWLAMVDSNSGQLLTVGKLSVLETLIVRGRCQARCNELYGHQERQTQVDLFDHYMPYICSRTQHYNCTQCSRACGEDMEDANSCLQKCDSEVCRRSCRFLHDAYVEESYESGRPSVQARNLPPSARILTVTKPASTCTYTTLSFLSPDPKSMVRLYWNVRDITNVSTSVALTFVVALKQCSSTGDGGASSPNCSISPSAWTFFNKTTNYSVIPVYDLEPNSTYLFKVLAVHWSGYIRGSVMSDPITTPPIQDKLDTPVELAVIQQYVRAGSVHAVVTWKPPPVSGGCYFRLYWMPPPPVTFEMVEIKYWGELKYELRKLAFNSVYTVELFNSDEDFLFHSECAKIKFTTLHSCLEATDYDYNLCPPEKPSKVNVSVSAPYMLNTTEEKLCDILVTWAPAKYRRYRNILSNYSLTFRKAPDMHNADVIRPHRGTYFLPASSNNYTIRHCHWDGVYEVTLRAHSPGGSSEPFTTSIEVGRGYNDYYDGGEAIEDKSVLYAATAPLLLGVVAVCVCLLFRWRIRHSKSVPDSIHREEINPLYESIGGSSKDEKLVADEYEIDFSALHILQTIGEGAFGKVLKAQLDMSAIGSPGTERRSSSRRKTVAVKMLKERATPDERRNLLLEIDAMKQLGQHQNLVSILACVTSAKRPCLVMHYCPLGDLRNFLRKHRKKTVTSSLCRHDQSSREYSRSDTSTGGSNRPGQLNSEEDSGISYASKTSQPHRLPENTSLQYSDGATGGSVTHSGSMSTDSSDNASMVFGCDERTAISQTKLLSFARQIALGMEYLTERKFIHRDLATRNILLYNHRQLKISDFGLARDVYETSMYQPTSARKLPYKWMPIESIFDQVFTIKSDVWSFGIVLWEIVTLGGCPYPGIPTQDLFRLLKEGYRMEKPENCSPEIYKMMLSCWHPRPEDRPSFTELKLMLEGSLEKAQSYIDLSVTVSEDYYKHDSDVSSNDQSAPFGSSRQPEGEEGQSISGVAEDGAGHSDHGASFPAAGSRWTVAAADVHVCQLFHNNSSDKNLILNVAESVTLQAPSSEMTLGRSSSVPVLQAADNEDLSGKNMRDCSPISASTCKREDEVELLRSQSKEEEEESLNLRVQCSGSLQSLDFTAPPQNGAGLGNHDEDMDQAEEDSFVVTPGKVHSTPLLTTSSPLSGRGSSSTDLTCDCDSPDNFSDGSVSSDRSSHQVRVHHAPSLTYGILSLLRGSKESDLSHKSQGRHRRQSRSLTDVNGLQMETKDADRDLAFAHATIVHL